MHDIDRTQLEFDPEMENFEYQQSEWLGEGGTVFNETDEMELAAELLEVSDEYELDQFLGNLIRRVGRGIGRVIRSPIGRAVGGVLKGVAKNALPLAGTALGGVVGGPLGAQIGGGLASAAGGALGLESETWGQEDREFEGAKQFVRLAGEAVKNATLAASSGSDPRSAAQAAVGRVVQAMAPGLLQSAAGGMSSYGGSRNGRWVRRGNRIVLLGV